MRRIFIIRKDLHLKPGKLAAMIGHCCEAYWTNLLKSAKTVDNEFDTLLAANPWKPDEPALYKDSDVYKASKTAFKRGDKTFQWPAYNSRATVTVSVEISKDIWNDYVNGIFTKTICECKNKSQLSKAESIAKELGLAEGVDYGYINDKCLTDLDPENDDGTCTVGIWFKPLEDSIAHKISKKFKLYRDE